MIAPGAARRAASGAACRRPASAVLAAAALGLLAACAGPAPAPAGKEWRFPEYELSLRVPENWRAEDVYALHARRAGVSEAEARALPLDDLVRRDPLLLLAHPPSDSGASAICMLSVSVEDLTRFPQVDTARAFAELAEQAARRNLPGYEKLGQDEEMAAGAAPAVRRDCRALQPIEGQPRPVRNLTLFLKRQGLGITVAAYELDERFADRRADFERILASVRLGPPAGRPGPFRRLLRWLSGSSDYSSSK